MSRVDHHLEWAKIVSYLDPCNHLLTDSPASSLAHLQPDTCTATWVIISKDKSDHTISSFMLETLQLIPTVLRMKAQLHTKAHRLRPAWSCPSPTHLHLSSPLQPHSLLSSSPSPSLSLHRASALGSPFCLKCSLLQFPTNLSFSEKPSFGFSVCHQERIL